MSKSTHVLRGGCLCGKVRYEIRAEPAMGGNCHCLNCQKTSGAGHAFHLMFPAEAFSIAGKTHAYNWTADSGNTVTSHFCPNCGSPIFGNSTGFAGMVTVRAASLDDSSGFSPQVAVYAKRAQSWDPVAPGIPAFADMPPPRG
jgi:hypothetical protein